MRFLLHPQSFKGLPKATTSVVYKAPSTGPLRVVVDPASLHPDNSARSAGVNATSAPPLCQASPSPAVLQPSENVLPPPVTDRRREAWGQQCSPHCGCVVRFEATTAAADQRVEAAAYHAKQLVVVSRHPNNTGASSPSSSPSSPGWSPLLTAKGRPMFQECQCSTLHHLCQSVVQHMVGRTWDQLRNGLEFQSVRSSAAFRGAVLRAQQLPVDEGGKCFDVVEDALTALVKGHLPKPRPAPILLPQRRPRPAPVASTAAGQRNPLVAPGSHGVYEASPEAEDTDADVWDAQHHYHQQQNHHHYEDERPTYPNLFWKEPPTYSFDWRAAAAHAGRSRPPHGSSALRWLDDVEQERRSAATRTSSPRPVPRDWVSYVDELQYPHYQRQRQLQQQEQLRPWREHGPRSQESSG